MILRNEEQMSRIAIEEIQLTRLKSVVNRVYEKIPHYRAKMEELDIKPKDIRTLDDLKLLPFTNKQDLRENYPFGLFAVPKSELVRIHASSGTTGKSTVVGYTKNDIKIWSELAGRIAAAGGAKKEDIAQICFSYGMFTGGLGLHYGLEHLGVTVCPSSAGNTEKQIMFMKDFKTTILVSTPSYALRIAEVAKTMGIDPSKDLNIRIGLFGGEGMSEAMRSEIYRLWGNHIKVTQNYGMSELIGPGVSGECLKLSGMHIQEDHFIPEIIDPNTGEVLPPGSTGELVITCMTKEALPLIRYRTRDISSLTYAPCECGRTNARMQNISSRIDDMLIIRGVNVFPSQIEEVLFKFPEISPHYQIVLDRKNYLDTIEINVELTEGLQLYSSDVLKNLRAAIKRNLRIVLGINTTINILEPNSLPRFEGKAKRIIDKKKNA
jgi:phenylacetate-CoA ligase